jgi:hypothetical protein
MELPIRNAVAQKNPQYFTDCLQMTAGIDSLNCYSLNIGVSHLMPSIDKNPVLSY